MADQNARPNDIVTMKQGDKTVNVVRSAFEKVWKDKGWELHEGTPQSPNPGANEGRQEDAPKSKGSSK